MLSPFRIAGRRICLRYQRGHLIPEQNGLKLAERLTWHRRDGTLKKAFHVSSYRPQESTLAPSHTRPHETLSTPSHATQGSIHELPAHCPGCGAPSQTVTLGSAGYYDLERRAVTSHLNSKRRESENEIFQAAMAHLNGEMDPDSETESAIGRLEAEVPTCDRCHRLRHHSEGEGIVHPSMDSIREIIEESPHKHNHIYHVLDAADFPLSLIPNLTTALELPHLRTQNRRSKSIRYSRGRVAEVSFVITRSDLLAPKKEQVDRLLPYLQDVLRDALGRSGRKVRLGNVRCVSSKRGWWTPNVKEDIWNRGGAAWMVGKVNVGKSALFEVVFPKGRKEQGKLEMERSERDAETSQRKTGQNLKKIAEQTWKSEVEQDETGLDKLLSVSQQDSNKSGLGKSKRKLRADDVVTQEKGLQESDLLLDDAHAKQLEEEALHSTEDEADLMDSLSLLPPPQPERQYPTMPLVSSLPGTTASPIRIPFGSGKGELIDLPGISRSNLSTHVLLEHHNDLIMHARPLPSQLSIKPGQSLLLGGMIRITPKIPPQDDGPSNDSLVYLVNPFLPTNVTAHVTNTEKAIGIQTGQLPDGTDYTGNVPSLLTQSSKSLIASAGDFPLSHDVTKSRTGALTDKAAGKMKPVNLPFIVYGIDILIEGVGWVELTCQIRRPRDMQSWSALDRQMKERLPEVEVWSPKGKYVGSRRPMNAWVLTGLRRGDKGKSRHGLKGRPRMSASFMERTRRGTG
ncbi:hypothetical protein K431DRAFT_282246 [Polychaeton citri CBS 116435]|uniref:Genetic interactor of prohibitins 3, mitochondrial n=1 Tax=Polychaeton citri CBS 116435 TaxID=1314669 RepID=A0A9P4QFJ8_9PEZI|nr:hypothetical protein K431DRAFT_282246 [Polychaeton citri CBS 116435]